MQSSNHYSPTFVRQSMSQKTVRVSSDVLHRQVNLPAVRISMAALNRQRVRRSRQAHCFAEGTTAAPPVDAPASLQIPKSIAEVDNGKILGFGADLAEDHPGFHDEAYKQRRVDIGNMARAHEVGQPIPYLEYAPEEVRVWDEVLDRLTVLYPTHACKAFLDTFPLFGFRKGQVPQLQDLSDILRSRTGWQIRPVAGLLHPRDFLNGLAFRTFHSTQYMRHSSNPMYTPEPDVCHELLGHVPMLADAAFCDLAYTIGVASLAANEKQIWHLTKLYWYTVEFGVVREDNDIKAFGAGILSSYGELEHMKKGNPELLPFDPFAKQPKMSYKDGFQKRYFVLQSFEDGAKLLRAYCASITPPEILEAYMGNSTRAAP